MSKFVLNIERAADDFANAESFWHNRKAQQLVKAIAQDAVFFFTAVEKTGCALIKCHVLLAANEINRRLQIQHLYCFSEDVRM